MGPLRPYAPLWREVPLSGRELRHACLALIDGARRPLTVAELRRRLEAAGFTVRGADPNKKLADVLRWEVTRGRLQRVGRGCYDVGHLPKVTASRVRRRWRESLEPER